MLGRQTIEQQLRTAFDGLTRAERQLANHITRSYPVPVLSSITALAKGAQVSTPTVVRLAQKLGFKGYPDLQTHVRAELEERLVSPIVKHDRWAEGLPDSHILNRFADSVVSNLQGTLGQIDHAEFDAVAALMADRDRRIFAVGGRITHAIADYFATHMTVIRPNVALLQATSNTWPAALIDMAPGDLLLAFDIRRYENAVLELVELAADQGAEVIVITDQWVSPAAAHARFRMSAHVEVPSAWDSTVAIQVLVEALLAAVETRIWDDTRGRMKRMEDLYARTRFFRRPR